MKRKYLPIIISVVILAVAVVILLVSVRKDGDRASDFTAVYMQTGDVYFGKMDWFPVPRLTNVWYIQRGSGQNPQVGIAPFKNAFWTPIDEIYINPKQIVFWTKIKGGSEMDEALKNPTALRPSENGAPQSASSSQGTFKGPNNQPPANP